MQVPDPVLLAAVEQFLVDHGVSPSAFGTKAMGDPTLVYELRKGRDCKASTRTKIMAFIERERLRAADSVPPVDPPAVECEAA